MRSKKTISLLQVFITLFLVLVAGAVVTVNTVGNVYAADISSSDLTVPGLTASYDTGTWSATNGNQLSGSATGSSGCSDSSQTSKLTLKNVKGEEALLTFNYSKPILATEGYVKIDGNSVTAAGSFSKKLANNATIVIEIYSGKAGANTSSINITNIVLVVEKNVTITFLSPTGYGTYTVDGTPISTETSIQKVSTTPFNMVATGGKDGNNIDYKFAGWLVDNVFNNNNASWSTLFDTDCTIRPVFYEKEKPVFFVEDSIFDDLDEADEAATAATSVHRITVIDSGLLKAKETEYTISTGNMLFIPYENTFSKVPTDNMTNFTFYQTYSNPVVFKKLVLDSNVIINVSNKASISVGGKICANSTLATSRNGVTFGDSGFLLMRRGSKVKLLSGSNFYCYGIVSDDKYTPSNQSELATYNAMDRGVIDAQSGSTVYEPMQILNWRGGTRTSGIYDKILPFNQYAIQNIEVDLKINAGAREYIQTLANMNSDTTTVGKCIFIGNSSDSSCLFKLTSGYLVKSYNPSNDYTDVVLNGNVSISSFSITIYVPITISDYNMPITSNLDIKVMGSSILTIDQDTVFLPGSRMFVDTNASLVIGADKALSFYDGDEWNGLQYASTSTNPYDTLPSPYTYANGALKIDNWIRKTKNLDDAELDLNGTLILNGSSSTKMHGGLFTTSTGANIHSSMFTGKIVFMNANTRTHSVKECKNNAANLVTTQLRPALLKNGSKFTNYGTSEEIIEYTDSSTVTRKGYGFDYGTYYDANNEKVNVLEEDPNVDTDTLGWGNPQVSKLNAKFNYVNDNNQVIVSNDPYTSTESYTPKPASIISSTYSVKYWKVSNFDAYFVPGVEIASMDYYGELQTLSPFFGGWLTKDGGLKFIPKELSETVEVKGLYCVNIANSGYNIKVNDICYFDAEGCFNGKYIGSSVYDSWENDGNHFKIFIDGSTSYLLKDGIVQKDYGLIKSNVENDDDSKFYYVGPSNTLYKNGWFYVSKINGVENISEGYYYFDSNGVMSLTGEKQSKPTIHNNVAYIQYVEEGSESNVTASNYGLFAYSPQGELSTFLYYAGDNGQLITNCSFYVSSDKINGCKIDITLVSEGLYYFDSHGRMFNSNFELIVNGAQ